MNGRVMDSTTWDATSKVSIPDLPITMATVIAGITANSRVSIRRNAG
jgi:hypothetical protein